MSKLKQYPLETKPKLLVIGNGMAGARCVEELLKLAPEKYQITMIGEEPHVNYNRIMLSPVLAGEKALDDIVINNTDWYQKNHIRLISGDPVVNIDRKNKGVTTASSKTFVYDKLIIATGSRPNIIELPGHDLRNVMGFRTIEDVDKMLKISRKLRHAVVIGGGLLGLEAADGLQKQGMRVTVIHNSDFLLNRQIDEKAATLLQDALIDKGVEFKLPAITEALVGNDAGQVQAVKLKDGTEISADLVVFATGVIPNTELARGAGIHCERGIVVNDTLQTFDPAIYAVGECVQHRGDLFGLVAPLFKQAKVCANHLAELGYGRFLTSPMATQLKVTGIDVYSAGEFAAEEQDDRTELLRYFDRELGIYKKLVLKDNKLVGAVLYGDIIDGAYYFELIQSHADIRNIRHLLMFGRGLCESRINTIATDRAA